MIALDPKSTALVLIDLQNGVLGRKLAPVSAEDLLERGKALARRFRAAGAPVVLVNVKPPLDGPERQVDEPSALPKVLPAGFADLAPGLAAPGDILITKSTWGAFFRTDLDAELKRRGDTYYRSRRRRNACRRRHDRAASVGAWLRTGHRARCRHQHGRRATRGDDAVYLSADRPGDG